MARKKRECMICGNTNAKELELVTLYSNEDGDYDVETEYICKEGKGCSC